MLDKGSIPLNIYEACLLLFWGVTPPLLRRRFDRKENTYLTHFSMRKGYSSQNKIMFVSDKHLQSQQCYRIIYPATVMKKYTFKFSADLHVNKHNHVLLPIELYFMLILSLKNNEEEVFIIYREMVNFIFIVLKDSAKCCYWEQWEISTVNPLYTDTWNNDKIRYNDNLNVTKSSLKKWRLMRNYAKTLHKIFKQHMFWIFDRISKTYILWGNKNKTRPFHTYHSVH